MHGLCLITFRPSEIYCDFLNSFSNYNVFVVVDDTEFNLSNFIQIYENTLLQIDNTYTNVDLLSNSCVENIDGDKSTWHWKNININHHVEFRDYLNV